MVEGVSSFGRGLLRGVTQYANLQRRWIIHHDIWNFQRDLKNWPFCDGAIIAWGDPKTRALQHRCSKHLVSCSGSADPSIMPVVTLDNDAVGRMAAEHLMDCRLEHFAFLGTDTSTTVSAKRLNGFSRALKQRGFSCKTMSIPQATHSDWLTHQHWPQMIADLQALPKPVGVFTVDDAVANDLAGACRQANISVPDQVAIIGVNDDDLLCESAWPPLSSVQADYSRAGFAAARLLERLMRGEKIKGSERLTLLPPLGVKQRASTNLLAVDDPNVAQAVRFIREHSCDPCSVADVLSFVPVNRRWLERQFVAKLGRTPHDEIVRVRMETARQLLLRRELALWEIAEKCGFSTVQGFSRVFGQAIGVSPAAYRRQALRG